jgi:hypothetical protein
VVRPVSDSSVVTRPQNSSAIRRRDPLAAAFTTILIVVTHPAHARAPPPVLPRQVDDALVCEVPRLSRRRLRETIGCRAPLRRVVQNVVEIVDELRLLERQRHPVEKGLIGFST